MPSWSAVKECVHCLAEPPLAVMNAGLYEAGSVKIEQVVVAARGDAAREASERRHLRHDIGDAFAGFGRRSVNVCGDDRSLEAAECRGDAHREDVEIDRHHGMADRRRSYWEEIRRRR